MNKLIEWICSRCIDTKYKVKPKDLQTTTCKECGVLHTKDDGIYIVTIRRRNERD